MRSNTGPWSGGETLATVNGSSKTPKLRRYPVPETGYLVLRGYTPDDAEVRAQAGDFFDKYPGWGVFGLSGYYAEDADGANVLLETKLARWRVVQVFKVEDLLASGLGLHATFRTPHVTITHRDVAGLLHRLTVCPHTVVVNRYNETQREDERG